jgi:hypothetical protein
MCTVFLTFPPTDRMHTTKLDGQLRAGSQARQGIVIGHRDGSLVRVRRQRVAAGRVASSVEPLVM